jgi:preprotein translocase subunit Sec61beta
MGVAPPPGAGTVSFTERERVMNMHLSIGPLVALIAGILILIMPRMLNYIVAIYLILVGVMGLFGGGNFNFR